MDIHERIRNRRKECGLTADEVAEKLGVSRATVYRYESADIVNMGIDKLEPLAEVLQTTPEYLMGWTDNPTDYDDPDLLNDIPLDLLQEWQRQGLHGAKLAKKWIEYQEAVQFDLETQRFYKELYRPPTSKETLMIRKYRDLDEHGKKMVDFVLNEEHQRVVAEVEAEIQAIKDEELRNSD